VSLVEEVPEHEGDELDSDEVDEGDEEERAALLSKGLEPEFSKTLLEALGTHAELYQRAYNALNDELIKVQIEEAVLRNVKTVVLNEKQGVV